jgi:hypothetical protein
MTRDDHPSQWTQLHRLSPRDPLDHLRLLWWVLVTPRQLKVYRNTFGEKDERGVGRWLVSTLIWLPLGIPTLALGLNILPRGADAFPPIFYLGCLMGLVLAWSLTARLGGVDIADSTAEVAPTGRGRVAALGAMLAVVLSIAFCVSIGVADALAKHTEFAMMVCACIAEGVAFVVADVVAKGTDSNILGGLESFVALGVAGFTAIGATNGVVDLVVNLAVIGMTIKIMLSVGEGVQESSRTGHPLWVARVIFGALVLVHILLVWFSFLGGAVYVDLN